MLKDCSVMTPCKTGNTRFLVGNTSAIPLLCLCCHAVFEILSGFTVKELLEGSETLPAYDQVWAQLTDLP